MNKIIAINLAAAFGLGAISDHLWGWLGLVFVLLLIIFVGSDIIYEITSK